MKVDERTKERKETNTHRTRPPSLDRPSRTGLEVDEGDVCPFLGCEAGGVSVSISVGCSF